MNKVIFTERESKLLEYKSKLSNFEQLIKTCIAFANGSGGRIIIGVDDKTLEVIGVSDQDREKLFEDFHKSIYDSTTPNILVQVYEKNIDRHSILIIEVPISPRKPYFLKNKGIAKGTYIRVGSHTRLATDDYIEDLTREAQRISYDEEIILQNIDILSNDLLKDYLNERVTKKRLLSEKIIAHRPANKELYAPTVAGVLMFCESPEEYITEALIRCTRFKGISGRDILRTEDITGTIEQQASQSIKIIENWIATHYELQGVKLKSVSLIPKVALREAIMNALLHRKYSIPGAVKVAVYDNRVEIFSPGDFPGLVDINSLGDGTTFLRNPVLVRLAYRLGLIETRGTGIRLIYDSCRKAGIKKPTYHDEGDFVKIIFYLEPSNDTGEDEEQIVLNYLEQHSKVTAQQIAQFLNVSHNTAIRKLKKLVAKQKVKRIGSGPSVCYMILK